MNWLIADAWAEAPSPVPQGSMLSTLIPFALLFVVFYFLLIRPQAKRTKEHKAMMAALAKGDEIVTSGGLFGRITHLGESVVTLEVSDKVEIKVQRQAIQAVMPKGTIKTASNEK